MKKILKTKTILWIVAVIVIVVVAVVLSMNYFVQPPVKSQGTAGMETTAVSGGQNE
jgi:hypothetical protein